MNFTRQVSQALDNEHRDSLELLGRVGRVFARAPGRDGARDPALIQVAGALERLIGLEIGRHFGFEERQLFPRMTQAGDGGLAELLQEEHETIQAVAAEVLPLARAAIDGTLDAAGFEGLRRGALELVERLGAHIQKETQALLPLLDDLLDEALDRELAFAYASA